ncbi:4Fe-4S dicluster domain-containing protein [Shinella sp.]|uniref:4Fe-4S dicluster domain-containing protein n=1 Tax=Shinella sp. TaxID=1870904 RepID=UPI00301BEBE6
MAATLALAGLSGCGAEADEKALPYVRDPEGFTGGAVRWYATAALFAGYGQPVLGKTVAGRPIKLEGNTDHPASGGATDAFTQAALLGLYDPARSQAPRREGRPVAWSLFERFASDLARTLDAQKGKGFRLLTGPLSSPTMLTQIAAMMRRWPQARWHVSDPAGPAEWRQAARQLFGRVLDRQPDFGKAEVVVSFDGDFLGPGPRQTLNARRFAEARRRRQAGKGRFRLLMAEPVPSATGTVADRRLVASPERIGRLLTALAEGLASGNVETAGLSRKEGGWLSDAARALKAAGPRGLVMAGDYLPADQQALAMRLNHRLGSFGETMGFCEPVLAAAPDGEESLSVLARDIDAGNVSVLMIMGANPAYAAPGDLDLARRLKAVATTIHAGTHRDETAALCHWHLPLQHDLESWGDARAVDGSGCILQPLVRPFYDVRAACVLLAGLMGRDVSDRMLVEETWRQRWGDDFSDRWQESLLRGRVADMAAPAVPPTPAEAPPAVAADSADEELVLLIRPDAGVWDGCLSDNAWAQETPRPLSKVTWGNVIGIGPGLARERRLASGDVVTVSLDGTSVTGPVSVTPGQDERVVSLTLGYGRRHDNGLAAGLGYDAYVLQQGMSRWQRSGVRLEPAGRREVIATTQPHQAMDGYDFVRTVSLGSAVPDGKQAEDNPSFYPKAPMESPSWGMTIDLDLCIGCNACVTACQAENNIPVVGRDLVAEGREMHWLRIDHYHEGDVADPKHHFQPVPCMHCEDAPCEMGCPVNATVHSADGLNLQVYNRCIGTRTCSSYCPYKVRHFNWFDFTADDPDSIRAMRNPEVTVRSRGVMEKCTYCVQRIAAARITADKEGRAIGEGEVVTACQQACPTGAILFGNVADPSSAIAKTKADPRNYALLAEANTRPRTTYLARIADPAEGEG